MVVALTSPIWLLFLSFSLSRFLSLRLFASLSLDLHFYLDERDGGRKTGLFENEPQQTVASSATKTTNPVCYK